MYDFTSVFLVEKFTLDLFGFYPYPKANMPLWRKIKYLLVYTYLTVNMLLIFISIIFVPIEQIVPQCLVLLMYLTFCLKVTTFIRNFRTVLKLENALKTNLTLKVPKTYSTVFQKHIDFANSLANYNRGMNLLYIMYYCLYKSVRNQTPVEVDGTFSCNKEICTILFHVNQTVCSLISVITNNNLECLFGKLVTVSVCLIEMVQRKLEELEFKDNENATAELRYIVQLHIDSLK